jgi:hypothetical protein
MRRLALAGLTAAALTFASPALASTASAAHRAGSCSASGDYATCVADGTATRPRYVYVHVTSDPAQQVQVYWSMVCTRNAGAGGSSGSFTATTAVRRLVRHPYSRPGSCSVAADAQLAGGGHLHAWISYRR